MCLILNGYLETAAWIYKYKIIVKVNNEGQIIYSKFYFNVNL